MKNVQAIAIRAYAASILSVWFFAGGNILSATDFATYQLTSDFNFPVIDDPADQAPVVFDNLSDGRLFGVSTLITDPDFATFLGEPKIFLETAVGSRSFQTFDLPLPGGAKWDAGGAAFVRVSPGTTGSVQIAVGNNRTDDPLVGVFRESDFLTLGPATMPIDWFEVDHFSGAWLDDRHLGINVGDFVNSQVTLLDTASDTTPGLEDNPTIVNGVEGASGGVGFDAEGNLYTGNGFDNGNGSPTGQIKKFDRADWEAALLATPLDFESDGTVVDTVLAAGSLVFDREGSLLVGGSDFFGGGQADFFSLLPGPGLGNTPRTFDPDAVATSTYVLAYNEVTREILAYQPFALDFPSNIDNTLVFVFTPAEISAAVPEPSTLLLLGFGLAVMFRRQRSAR